MGARSCLWFFWFVMALVTGAYCALSLLTFSNVYKAYDKSDEKGDKDSSVLAILAASFFGSVMVFMYAFVSFCILLGKTALKSGAGFSYGFITSSSIHMALMCLLCGLVLSGFKDEVKTRYENDSEKDDSEKLGISWGKFDTAAFEASFWMAYVSTLVYLLFFVILVFDKRAVQKSKQESSKLDESVKA